MKFPTLVTAELIRRYQRFLADVRLPDGRELTVHCPNTGAMTGCAEPGSPVWLQDVNNPQRKYRYRWELVETGAGLACIHSARANGLVAEALDRQLLPPFAGMLEYQTEQRYGQENSRIDFCLQFPGQACYLEVKAVTLCRPGGLGVFPDAVSSRGQKHLRELMAIRQQGHRAALLFVAQHTGIDRVAPAADIDPAYAALVEQALAAGVECYACATDITPESIVITELIPFLPTGC